MAGYKRLIKRYTLIGIIEHTDKEKSTTRLWTFSVINQEHLISRGELGKMVEFSWRFINPTYQRNGGTLILPLNKRNIALLEVFSEWSGHSPSKKNRFTFKHFRKFLLLKRISTRMRNLEL